MDDPDIDLLWPENPHWLPGDWRKVTDPLEQLRLISQNPLLATLTLSVNVAHSLLPNPDAKMALNSYTLLGGAIGKFSRDADIDIPQIYLDTLIPGKQGIIGTRNNTLIDDSKLPSITMIIHLIDAFSRLNLVNIHKMSSIIKFLKKAFPLNGSDKKTSTMMRTGCKNEIFYRKITYMILCFILGTYDWIEEPQFDFDVQCWIVDFFFKTKRKDMVKFYTDKKNKALILFSCTALILQTASQIPAYLKILESVYNWEELKTVTRNSVKEFRKALIDAKLIGRLTGPSYEIIEIVSEILRENISLRRDSFKSKKNDISNIFPNIISAAKNMHSGGIKKNRYNVMDLSGLSTVNSQIWKRAFSLIQQYGHGINWESFSRLGFTKRGEKCVLRILRDLDAGNPSNVDFYRSLGPGDFSIFLAYIAAQRNANEIHYTSLGKTIAEKQRESLRKIHHKLPWQDLPLNATDLYFCPNCLKFKPYTAKSKQTGIENVGYNPMTGRVYCFDSDKPECCHLLRIHMIGMALTVKRKTWILCCYCGKLCIYGNANIEDSFWWCGYCDRDCCH